MGTVGLLYVGAVLFINGLMLLGKIETRAAAILNLFVGALQVITPTVLIISASGQTDQTLKADQILGASGIFLFGFTYLYVGIGLLGGFDSTGVGYFSLFVAIMALGFSFANYQILKDRPFAVIWLNWAFLWLLFFLLLGLKHAHLAHYTGWVTAIQGWVTAAIPAYFILTGYWQRWNQNLLATVLLVFGVVVFGALWLLERRREVIPAPAGGETTTAR